MRLMSFSSGGAASWGVVEGESVVDCSSLAPSLRAALPNLPGLVGEIVGLPRHALASVTFLPPIRRPGEDHLHRAELPDAHPGGWAGTAEAADHLHPLGQHPGRARPVRSCGRTLSDTLDFEGELAVVIGRELPPRRRRRTSCQRDRRL